MTLAVLADIGRFCFLFLFRHVFRDNKISNINTNKNKTVTTTAATLWPPAPSTCGANWFGPSAEYFNGLFCGNINARYLTIGGRLGALGNINIYDTFNIGSTLNPTYQTYDRRAYKYTIIGGKVSLVRGRITNGGIGIQSPANIEGNFVSLPIKSAVQEKGDSVDYEVANALPSEYYDLWTRLATAFGAVESNAVVTDASNDNTLLYVGCNQKVAGNVYVVKLTVDQIGSSKTIDLDPTQTFAADSTVIFLVPSLSVSIKLRTGTRLSLLKNRILWVFPTAKILKLTSPIAGSIFAPHAAVSSEGGAVQGQLFGYHYSECDRGGLTLSWDVFTGCMPALFPATYATTSVPVTATTTAATTPVPSSSTTVVTTTALVSTTTVVTTSSPVSTTTTVVTTSTVAPSSTVAAEVASCDTTFATSKFNLFNVLVLENFEVQSSIVEGRVAAAGDIRINGPWSAGNKLQDPVKKCSEIDAAGSYNRTLIAGKALIWTHNGGSVENGHVVVGDAARSSISVSLNRTLTYWNCSMVTNAQALDFTAAGTWLKETSKRLASLSSTVTISRPATEPSAMVLKFAGNRQVEVLNIACSYLNSVRTIKFDSNYPIATNAVFIINIGGVNATLGSGDYEVLKSISKRVIINVYEATTLTIERVATYGLLLAPVATLTKQSTGVHWGQIFAYAFKADQFSVSWAPYESCIPSSQSQPQSTTSGVSPTATTTSTSTPTSPAIVRTCSTPTPYISQSIFGQYAWLYNAIFLNNASFVGGNIGGRLAVGGYLNSNTSCTIAKSLYSTPQNYSQLVQSANYTGALLVGGGATLLGTDCEVLGDIIAYNPYEIQYANSVKTCLQTNGFALTECLSAPMNFTQYRNIWSTISTNFMSIFPSLRAGLDGSSLYLRRHIRTYANLEVLLVSSYELSVADHYVFDGCALSSSSYLIINVVGEDITIKGSESLKPYSNRVIWNFYRAKTVRIYGRMDGIILAPSATIITMQNVTISGCVFADNLQSVYGVDIAWNGPCQWPSLYNLPMYRPFTQDTCCKAGEPGALTTTTVPSTTPGISGNSTASIAQTITNPPVTTAISSIPPATITQGAYDPPFVDAMCDRKFEELKISLFNVLVLENFEIQSADVEGRLAAAGDIHINGPWSAGDKLQLPAKKCPELEAMGSYNRTIVAGQALLWPHNGGTVENGHIAVGDYSRTNISLSLNRSLEYWGCSMIADAQALDFVTIRAWFLATSKRFATFQTTVTIVRPTTEPSTMLLQFNGKRQVEVLNLTCGYLNDVRTIKFDPAYPLAKDAVFIINIDGKQEKLGPADYEVLKTIGHRLIINFHEAIDLTIEQTATHGLLLAPHATLTRRSTGVHWGHFFAFAFKADQFQVNWVAYNSCMPGTQTQALRDPNTSPFLSAGVNLGVMIWQLALSIVSALLFIVLPL